ncbi:hypothetical protein DB30_00464 [Enhygromyxa salina]|uniref:Uncharacterized protein n=1 Tax=Enhygromyxa salina TaxID=215803 RepID=A0A0C2CPZ6_9BACT|nr:hypothetical protein DB30_00464 [Enhygromyxa salina]
MTSMRDIHPPGCRTWSGLTSANGVERALRRVFGITLAESAALAESIDRAGKYIWTGVVASTAVACCGARPPDAGAAAGAIGADALEEYCD